MEPDKSGIIQEACGVLQKSGAEKARQLIQAQYPFDPQPRAERSSSTRKKMETFYRDGFIDRYTGQRLVCQGVLHVLSTELGPKTFPYHLNWRMDKGHMAYWHLAPTIDHVIPIARGGIDEPSNWVTASQVTNSSKSNFTIEELGWQLVPAGDPAEWDGLVGWFLEYVAANPQVEEDRRVLDWVKEARRVVD